MLAGSSVRRVAIVGGTRIPFSRSLRRVRARSQPGHDDRGAARRSSTATGSKGERLGDVAPARSSSTRATATSRANRVLGRGLAPETPGVRHAARLRHEPRGSDPHRQQDRARPDRHRHRRRHRHHQRPPIVYPDAYRAAAARELRAAKHASADGSSLGSGCGRGISSPCCRASSSRAPGCRWAEHAR